MNQNTLVVAAIVVLRVIGGGYILLRQPDEQSDTPEPQTPPVVSCIVAVHGSADDFSSKHTGRGMVTISID